jgi:protein-L-isoaspartate(D-aspartate) O-methyltransferase
MGNSSSDSALALNETLIAQLKQEGNLHDPRVEAAFRAVPRHLFLPDLPLDQAYKDDAIPTKRLDSGEVVSSSSQPAMMAIMLEQLDLQPGQRVLEIGAGTGYNAALMAHLVGETGHVITLDIDQDIVDAAREHLAAAGIPGVEVVQGDGALGYPESAPYDRIILTVGAWDLPPAWLDQLKPDGRLVLPLDIKGTQKSVAFEWRDDHLESLSVRACQFMTLRGQAARPDYTILIGPEPGIRFGSASPIDADANMLYNLLTGPYHDLPTTIKVTAYEVFDGVSLWLELREPGFCGIGAEGAAAAHVPYLYGLAGKFVSTLGLYNGQTNQLCTLMRPPDETPPAEPPKDRNQPFELYVRSFGQSGPLASILVERVIAWSMTGRRSSKGMRIRVYPQGYDYQPSSNEIVIPKGQTQLVIDWPA